MALTQISTAGVKDDAVTAGKIPANAVGSSEIAANAVGSSELADNAVDTAAIADDAVTFDKIAHIPTARIVGRSTSGTGTLEAMTASTLRTVLNVEDGATATSGTTINNNADNRVITGSGTANTLNGESGLTYDSTTLVVNGSGIVKVRSATADNTDKQAFFTTGHYDTAEEDVLGLRIVGGNADNVVDIGGGSGQSSYNSATKIRFYTGANDTTLTGTERMRINPDGKVGLGITSPVGRLHLHQADSGTIDGLIITNTSTTNNGLTVGVNSNEQPFFWNGSNTDMLFATNNTERMRILAGGGLTFNGDTAAANALDDYEEGNWTPAFEDLSNTPTYYNLAGKYVKIGSFVTIWGMIQIGGTQPTFTNNTHQLKIAGLPFANDATTGYVGGAGPVTFQSWNIFGSTYNDYGANGVVTCGVTNSTRILFAVNPDANGGIRGTARRKSFEGGPIVTWTMSYRTTA